MVIYENNKRGFFNDVRDNLIANRIEQAFVKKGFYHNNEAEYISWSNSLNFVRNAIDDPEIDDECRLSIEYQVPLTSKRVDFLIAGEDENRNNNVVVIELKQWSDSGITSRKDVVTAYTGGGNRAVTHPSYQAYSYAKTIEYFNESVDINNIFLYPCAYLHNYKELNRSHIDNDLYCEAIKLAPIYLENDTPKLRDFIKKYIKKRDGIDILMKIENGKLKPAKALQDCLASMLNGNKEFCLIDEQKIVYETVSKLVTKAVRETNKATSKFQKAVVICQGGPGTGKSVVAIQLLNDLISKGFSANYITKNAAPRNVCFNKLRQEDFKNNYINSLFKSSGSFSNAKNNDLNCAIVDEAHRLITKTRFSGENQIKEIISAAQVSVFLLTKTNELPLKT